MQVLHLKAHDGLKLYGWQRDPKQKPKAQMLLIHGYGEHCGRYKPITDLLLEMDIKVCAFDHRGHGRSEGHPVYFERYEHLVEDLAAVISQVREPDLPFFMLGHSLGGGVLAHYAAKFQPEVAGLIFSSALLKLELPPAPIMWLSRLTSKFLPKGKVPSFFYQFDTSALSRRPEVVAAYEADPLVHAAKLLNRSGREMTLLAQDIQAEFGKITAPLLAMHGDEDRLTWVEGSKSLYEEAGAEDKTLNMYPGGYHELMLDLCADEVLSDIRSWIEARLGFCTR